LLARKQGGQREEALKVPIAREELIASPRPIYLSSIIPELYTQQRHDGVWVATELPGREGA